MLLSINELIIWTGLGPFEVAVHCFALFLFTILAVLKVDDIITSTWHSVFIPLYVATAINTYYDIILFIRMLYYAFLNHHTRSREMKRLVLYIVISNVLGIGLLVFLQHSVAEYLDVGMDYHVPLVVSVTMFLGYVFVRMFLVYRTLV